MVFLQPCLPIMLPQNHHCVSSSSWWVNIMKQPISLSHGVIQCPRWHPRLSCCIMSEFQVQEGYWTHFPASWSSVCWDVDEEHLSSAVLDKDLMKHLAHLLLSPRWWCQRALLPMAALCSATHRWLLASCLQFFSLEILVLFVSYLGDAKPYLAVSVGLVVCICEKTPDFCTTSCNTERSLWVCQALCMPLWDLYLSSSFLMKFKHSGDFYQWSESI